MDQVIECIKEDYDYYIDKINNCAAYFVEKKFSMISYNFDESLIDKIKKAGIKLSDFSPYVNKICCSDYSKLLLIILFSFSVEV